jgi:hypothetical protein
MNPRMDGGRLAAEATEAVGGLRVFVEFFEVQKGKPVSDLVMTLSCGVCGRAAQIVPGLL